MRGCLKGVQRQEWDRFIPLRRAVTGSNFYYGILTAVKREEEEGLLEQDILNVNVGNYRRLLETVLGLQGKSARLYIFQRATFMTNEVSKEFHWPVRARKRPLIEKPSVILDLPEFKPSLDHNLVDWGSEYLAAALHTNVFIWNADKEKGKKLTKVVPGYCSSLKWSNIGNLLAIGTTSGMVQVWNDKKFERFFVCKHFIQDECAIHAFAWHPFANDLVSGCSKGRIGVYKKCRFIEAHESQISALRFSPDGTFLASSGGDCAVRLWQWPHLQPYMEVMGETNEPIRALAWHPWHTSYLVIGEGTTGSITLWNVRLCHMVASAQLGEVQVKGLEFNRITGELLVNVWNPGAEEEESTNGHSTALVLANFNDVVDRIDFNAGVVFQIMWDSSGEQLAAVGEDETLRIWNFLGSSARRSEANCYRSILAPLHPPGFKIPPKYGVKLYDRMTCCFVDNNKKQPPPYEHHFGCRIR